jgi:hypothetical protein
MPVCALTALATTGTLCAVWSKFFIEIMLAKKMSIYDNFFMMRKAVLVIIVFMGVLSCGKKDSGGLTEEEENDFFNRMVHLERGYNLALTHGPWKVRLANGATIGKVKSADKEYSENAMDKAYLGINSEDDYDIIIINAEDDAYKTMARDNI